MKEEETQHLLCCGHQGNMPDERDLGKERSRETSEEDKSAPEEGETYAERNAAEEAARGDDLDTEEQRAAEVGAAREINTEIRLTEENSAAESTPAEIGVEGQVRKEEVTAPNKEPPDLGLSQQEVSGKENGQLSGTHEAEAAAPHTKQRETGQNEKETAGGINPSRDHNTSETEREPEAAMEVVDAGGCDGNRGRDRS